MLGLDAAGKTSMFIAPFYYVLKSSSSLTFAPLRYSNSVQVETRSRRNDDTDCWLQRGDRNVQECQVQCVGEFT